MKKTRTCRYHCASCQRAHRPSCFTSLIAFDAHIKYVKDKDAPGGMHSFHEITRDPGDTPLIPVPGECRLQNGTEAPCHTTLYTTHG